MRSRQPRSPEALREARSNIAAASCLISHYASYKDYAPFTTEEEQAFNHTLAMVEEFSQFMYSRRKEELDGV